MKSKSAGVGRRAGGAAGAGRPPGKNRAPRSAGARRGSSSGTSQGASLGESAKQIGEYIAGIPEGSRKTFDALRAAVREAAPRDAEETISYGIPALRRERVLVWYAAFAKHCSLFPSAAVLTAFKDELKGFVVSKGTVQFRVDALLPVGLVKKLVRARVAEAAKK